MSKIFVSYRRDDSAGHTGRLVDHLVSRFGSDAVYRDLESIEIGADFSVAIEDALAQCEILLVVIGDTWFDETNKKRLHKTGDWVRQEIASGLRRPNITVIPVLVDGAIMPKASELPGDLKSLAMKNAMTVSDKDWDHHVQKLGNSFAHKVSNTTVSNNELDSVTINNSASQPKRKWGMIVGLSMLGVLLLGGIGFGIYWMTRSNESKQVVEVPDLVGLERNLSMQILTEIDLTGRALVDPSSTDPTGTVTRLTPQPGKKVNKGATVVLLYSEGLELAEITTPSVAGRTIQQAERAFEEAGLIPRFIGQTSNSIEEDRIIRTTPAPGEVVPEDLTITAYYSEGPLQNASNDVVEDNSKPGIVRIPDMRNKAIGEAKRTLAGLGFKVKTTAKLDKKRNKNIVISTNPAYGSEIEEGSEVNIYYSKAPTNITDLSSKYELSESVQKDLQRTITSNSPLVNHLRNIRCQSSTQGKIAWDGVNNTTWTQNNLSRLCKGAETSTEPGKCFDMVVKGRLSYGSGNSWNPANAVDLCEGSTNAANTTACFSRYVQAGRTWSQAIKQCSK